MLPSCIHQNNSKRESILFDKALKVDSISSLKQRKIVYVFNGNCSLCVLKLKELQDKIANISIKPIFIATQADADILTYNLEQINFKYQVIIDSLNLLQSKNPQLDIKNDSFFLLDSCNSILSNSNTLPKNLIFSQ